jgi:hypothetical protein
MDCLSHSVATSSNTDLEHYQKTELFLVIGSLQAGNVNLFHFKHGLHDPFRFLAVVIAQYFAQSRGNNLPRQTEFVLQRAALTFFSARGALGRLLPASRNSQKTKWPR